MGRRACFFFSFCLRRWTVKVFRRKWSCGNSIDVESLPSTGLFFILYIYVRYKYWYRVARGVTFRIKPVGVDCCNVQTCFN
ncbi:hypothetical protein BX600DRAFT_79435 [Xylariales sp. PMI_506]|nr:hypothetical protein BX600DRAFT_79435 [Xylariales sp. PMI_506]